MRDADTEPTLRQAAEFFAGALRQVDSWKRPAGTLPPEETRILRRQQFAVLVNELKLWHGFAVSPPAGCKAVADSLVMLSQRFRAIGAERRERPDIDVAEYADHVRRIVNDGLAAVGEELQRDPLDGFGEQAASHLPDAADDQSKSTKSRASLLAYKSFAYAERQSGASTDREAWDWLRQNEITDDAELLNYVLPAYDTWARYVRNARQNLGTSKNHSQQGVAPSHRRNGKPLPRNDKPARSVVRRDEL